jgi:hypothetical protein
MRRPPAARASRHRRALVLGAALPAIALLGAGCLFGSTSPTPGASASTAVSTPTEAGSAAPATSGPSATGTAAPAPSGLAAGIYARVVVDGLNVRISAKTDATPIGALFFGDVVLIRSDAGMVGGLHWYEIETYQTANNQRLLGFVAAGANGQAFLEALAGKPSPTPVPTPTPAPTATPSSAPSASSS